MWVSIPNIEGYLINKRGKVKNEKTGRVLKVRWIGRDRAYQSVMIRNKVHYIHRLVALTFIPNPDNLPFVNHKDENKSNNCVDNLEWCTNEYNLKYGTTQERNKQTNLDRFPIERYEVVPATRYTFKLACSRRGLNIEDYIQKLHHIEKTEGGNNVRYYNYFKRN